MNKDMSGIKKQIQIYTKDGVEAGKVLGNIHSQLVGNQDYIDSNIVLNDDLHIVDDTIVGMIITYTVYEESKTNPKLNIKF